MSRKRTVNAMLKFCYEELKASKLETVFGNRNLSESQF